MRGEFEAERAGDKAAIEVVEMYIEYLSTGIANIINISGQKLLYLVVVCLHKSSILQTGCL